MKKIFKTLMITIGFAIILSIGSKIEAASATISANSTATVGKSVAVTVRVNAATWNLNVSGAASGNIVGVNMNGKNQSTTKTYKITPSKEGKYTVYLKGDITDASGKTLDINKSVTITAKKASSNTDTSKGDNNKDDENSKKSSNANLGTLGITPKKYDFSGFNSNKTSYSVTVPNDVDSLKVSYKTADSKSTVKVTGNTNLEVGTNTIKVIVTAEDGKTTKTYVIKVTKLATEDNKPGNVIDEENDLDLYLTSLNIKGLELTPEFSSDVYSYETTIDMDHRDMSSVTVEAIANNEKATVEVTGNTNLVEGENLINVIVKASGSSDQTVYQITVNKISQASEIVSSNNIIDKIKNIKREYLIIGGFIFIVVVILAIIIINHMRNKRYYEEYEEEEPDFYDNNLDTVEGEEKNSNLVEELFKKRNNGEELNEEEKETIEDIENENDRIFNKPKKGETVEYDEQEQENNEEALTEDYIEERMKKRKGKHF